MLHGRTVVPYITAWSGEHTALPEVVATSSGIAYADETLIDRDGEGVLWRRQPSRPRQGHPEFRKVHPVRQRRAMRRLLCQVCGGPADRNEHGVLWLLRDHHDNWPNWPEGMANTYPPVCLPCARASIRECPALRQGYVAVRARHCPIVGVYGVRYALAGSLATPSGGTIATYEEPAIDWTLATQLVRSLHDCTPTGREVTA